VLPSLSIVLQLTRGVGLPPITIQDSLKRSPSTPETSLPFSTCESLYSI
jgi:hypothetical protein